MEFRIGESTLVIEEGDITESTDDAIVNPANSRLKMGGGVAGLIKRKGGETIQEECDRIGYCEEGNAVITTAGRLKARYVIHAVGPVWRGGEKGEDGMLISAVRNTLRVAVANSISSISIPAISTGIFGFPMERAAELSVKTVRDFILETGNPKLVRFVLYGREAFEIFLRAAEALLLDRVDR